MRSIKFLLHTATASLFLAAAFAQATQVTGTVTNKTTGKPVVGDTVVLVDVQAGMGEVAHTTTDARGHYALTLPGNSPYLVRVTHQGAGYFIAAPQGARPAIFRSMTWQPRSMASLSKPTCWRLSPTMASFA